MESKSKVVGESMEVKRTLTLHVILIGIGFVMLLGIPLINLFLGMLLLLSIAIKIFSRSNQVATDLFWLLVGAALCFVGMLIYPVAQMFSSMSIGSSIFWGAVIRAVAYAWIVCGKLGHLYIDKDALAKL